jgi:antitoxin MazE
MKTHIVKIGNSQGIRIPKPILEQCGFGREVELEVHDQELVIRPIHQPRQKWEEAFQAMAAYGDDTLLDGEIGSQTTWDEDEWEWT